MSDTPKPTSRMGYPFSAQDGKPFADAQPAYEGLAMADGGHFPLGNNGHFHGGIHFDRATANVFAIDEGVHCLADGEVIAYRFDKRYPDATPSAAEGGMVSDSKVVLRPYSTGFVLVRHRLQPPALPVSASEDEVAQTITELDYGTPLAARVNGPTIGWVPVYARVTLLEIQGGWVKVRILLPSVGTWTNEPVDEPWLRTRSLDNVPTSIPNRWFGGEPPTAIVVLSSQPPPAPQRAPAQARSSSMPPPSLVLYSLYMHLADGATYDAKPELQRPGWWPRKQYRVGNKATNKKTIRGKRFDGLMVRSSPASKTDNELGVLVRGSVIDVEPIAGNDRWVAVRSIVEGGVATEPDGAQITSLSVTGYVFVKELDEILTPGSFDSIVIPSSPTLINMGDVIGHMGQQVSSCETLIAGQPASRPTLHLEVFSAQDVPQFLRDSKRYADKLPERHWTMIKLRKGDPVRAEAKDEAPMVVTMARDWTIAVTRDTSLQKDEQDQSWVYVKVSAADGSEVVGWAKDVDRRCTPWHWPDFEVVDAASNDAGTWWDGTAKAFIDFLRGGARPSETPFFKQVRQLVDSNDDGKLSEEELDAALKNRAVARRLGGLIAYHTNEWFVPSWASKYGVISEVAMGLGKRAMENVEAEKSCVLRLRWWSDAAPKLKLPADAKVYHLHPIGIGSLLSARLHPVIRLFGKSVELDFLDLYRGQELTNDEIQEAARDLGCEPGLIYAIARQESAHSSFVNIDDENIPTILFERHWFARLAKNPVFGREYPEIYGSAYRRAKKDSNGFYKDVKTGAELASIDVYGSSGRQQYERLIKAYMLNEDAALQACSWGKFQIMGFNFSAAGFKSIKEFAVAMSHSDAEHMKAFLKFAKSNSTLLAGLRSKNFEKIAEGHNGAGWRSINPDYAANIERYYNEYSSFNR
ncbi:N-acetylmuramidase domain-containing protein [Pseudomonas protegens]|uniref:N-acetylmuramidase domain-containing protein n=1 Tax=Pseudomonas protegens TaxID=380021 RepID=UPI003850BC15